MSTPEADALERALRARPLPAPLPAELAGEFVWPAYDGHSLVNVPATLGRILGVSLQRCAPPLAALYWRSWAADVRRVVVVLLDALGYLQLRQMLEQFPTCLWARLAAQGLLLPMTSIFPSTTSTALATLLTGAEPIAHGLLGYELWLREYGVLTEMLSLKPAYGTGQETLLQWGLVPESFLPVPSLGEMLAQAGVSFTALVPAPFLRGGLTRMCYRQVQRLIGYNGLESLWALARNAVEQERSERSLFFLYWGGIDGAIHDHGSGEGAWVHQFQLVTQACETLFLAHLSPEIRRETLLIMLADHGFVDSPAELAHDTDADPVFRARALIPFSGESRAAYLFSASGPGESASLAFRQTLGDRFVVLRSRDAIQAGLFGLGKPSPQALARLGHFLVIPRGLHYLDRQNKRNILRGRHGGLSPEEMLVPWLAVRLDSL